jgi:hypothetical protein
MDFYAGNMSLLNDIAQIENDAGRSGSGAAPAAARPEGYAPHDAHADGAVRSDHRLVRGVQIRPSPRSIRARSSAGLLGNHFRRSQIISGNWSTCRPTSRLLRRATARMTPSRRRSIGGSFEGFAPSAVQAEEKKLKPLSIGAEQEVRIHLPPAKSQQQTRFRHFRHGGFGGARNAAVNKTRCA